MHNVRAINPDTTKTIVGTSTPLVLVVLRAIVVSLVVLFFFVGVPALNAGGIVPDYKVQLLGKYLCFALVALGADLIWGYTGLLSLCQALFFCVGGYAVAMYLSLPQGGGTFEVPQFLSFVYYGTGSDPLPPFWKPFQSLSIAILLGLLVSAGLATVFGFFMFRSRVRGVYFSIVTQAVAWGMWLLLCQNEMLMGGTNGLTNYSKSFSQERKWIVGLYLLTLTMVVLGYLVCRWITRARLGRVMVAIRDKEMRLYFAGYKPYAFKVFAFAVAALLGAVGGMLYPAQVGILTPQDMNVPASINVVIFVAVGGRGRLWGAIFGALLINMLRSVLTSDMASVWPYVYGLLFVAVVLFYPDGFVGLWERFEKSIVERSGWLLSSSLVLPIAVIVLFLGAEILGVMPDRLQEPTNLWRGQAIAIVVLLIGILVWLVMIAMEMPRAWGITLGVLGGFVDLSLAVLSALRFTDPITLKLKYILLLLGIAFAAVLYVFSIWVTARKTAEERRGFDPARVAGGGEAT